MRHPVCYVLEVLVIVCIGTLLSTLFVKLSIRNELFTENKKQIPNFNHSNFESEKRNNKKTRTKI